MSIGRRPAVFAMIIAASLLAMAPAMSIDRLYWYQLYEPESIDLSETSLALAGKTIEIVGYMAPPLKADSEFFVLTDVPMETCPFCDDVALWPNNIIYVTSDRTLPVIAYNRQISVTGVLDIGPEVDPATGFVSLVRLELARVSGG